MAELIDCSVGHMSAIENGKVMPSGDELVAFCKLYEIDMHYLFSSLLPFYNEQQKSQTEAGQQYFEHLPDEAIRWLVQVSGDFHILATEEKERRKNNR